MIAHIQAVRELDQRQGEPQNREYLGLASQSPADRKPLAGIAGEERENQVEEGRTHAEPPASSSPEFQKFMRDWQDILEAV